jgi:hypothetical protein
MLRRPGGDVDFSRWLLNLDNDVAGIAERLILAEEVLDDVVNSYDRIRLVTVQYAARMLRVWTDKLR